MNNNWYIITNTENLLHFINYGLIFDKQGFTRASATQTSYMIDAMDDIPLGYIPCFTADKAYDALEKAREEDMNLKGCFLEIDIKQITQMSAWCGFVQNPSHVYNQKMVSSHDDLLKNQQVNCVLLPAPLPFSLIKNIILQDAETRDKVAELYQQKFNSWTTKKSFITVKANLFKAPKKINADDSILTDHNAQDIDETQHWQAEPKILEYQKAFSYGGALGLLYYQTKNGRQTADIFEVLSDITTLIDKDYQNQDNLSAVVPFLEYLSDTMPLSNDIVILYKRLIDKLATIENHGVACEFILSVLKSNDIPERYKDYCFKLSKSLERIVERTNDKDPETILEIIINELYPEDIDFKNFTFLITLFFLRDHTETLLKYHHNAFTQNSYALLAVFFGLISGSVNIPNTIRQSYELTSWLSFKMAEYMHAKQGQSITFKMPTRPLLLYGDYIKGKSSKNHKIHNFYEWLDKKLYPDAQEVESPFIEWKIALPKSYKIEDNKYLIAEVKPDILATVNTALLEHYMQSKIKEDDLFDFNKITAAYKKFNK